MEHIKTTIQLFVVAIMLLSITGIQKSYHQCNSSGNYEYKISLPVIAQNSTDNEFDCSCISDHSEYDQCATYCNEPKTVEEHTECCKTGTETQFANFEYLYSSISKVEKANELLLFKATNSKSETPILLEDRREKSSKKELPPNIKNRGKHILILQNQLKVPLT